MEAEATPVGAPSQVGVDQIHESKTNPRRHFDDAKLTELAESIGKHGVLQALVVRPHPSKKGHFELVAGARRLRASIKAGLVEVPVSCRDLTDMEVLELQLIENLQRDDLDALSEAEGYQRLIKTGKYDVATIALRIGKSPKYVYDRVKLLALVPEAKKLMERGLIGAAHAILLARLSPEDQKKAITPSVEYGNGPLFVDEDDRALFSTEEEDEREERAQKDPYVGMKARSVRELEAWIADHVRFKVQEPVNVDLYPETAQIVDEAKAEKCKVVEITRNYMLNDDTREAGSRVYGERSWKRADGKEKSQHCDKAVLGVVVVGPGRGDAFSVCIDKKGCKTHWAKEQKESARSGIRTQRQSPEERKAEEQQRRAREEADEQKRLAAEKRWKEAVPAIAKALVGRLEDLPVSSSGKMASFVLAALIGNNVPREMFKLCPLTKRPESVIRRAAFLLLADGFGRPWSRQNFIHSLAKDWGVDVAAILKTQEPKPPKKESGKAKAKPAAKKQGKKK